MDSLKAQERVPVLGGVHSAGIRQRLALLSPKTKHLQTVRGVGIAPGVMLLHVATTGMAG